MRRTDIPFVVRTVGTLTYNDRQVALITTKYEGWIEKVHVNYVGEPVRKGQDLFDIYSPQLVTTEREYLQALAYAKTLAGSPYADAAARAQALVASARQRLQYWDVSDAQIDELARSGQVQRTLCVVSPVNGLVVEKMNQALEGMRATPGMQLYKIVDLSTLWVDVQIFENQVPWVRVGQRATIELPYEPGRSHSGVVRFLHPSLDAKTRTMTASIELPNPGPKLRAAMYANVIINVPSAHHVLAVPDNAVIHSGQRDVVVLDLGHGLFPARDVTLGVDGDGLWQVVGGVDEGDRVVVSAQFLIDSESNLKAAVARFRHRRARRRARANHTEGDMLERLIDWSIRNKFLVILATALVALGGIYAVEQTPLDAIPDLSDVQVIIYTEYPGQAPQVVEDQVTYPMTTQMLAVPYAKVVRGYSFFGYSFVYVIFEDGTDLYWARSRVLEYLNYVGGKLPAASRRRSVRTRPVSGGRSCTSCSRRSATSPSCGPSRTGTSSTSSRACRACPRSRAWAGS